MGVMERRRCVHKVQPQAVFCYISIIHGGKGSGDTQYQVFFCFKTSLNTQHQVFLRNPLHVGELAIDFQIGSKPNLRFLPMEINPESRDKVLCVLVEDQRMFGQLLNVFLSAVEGLEVVANVETVVEGIDACRKHTPDLLILDLLLPDGDGTEVARFLMNQNPGSRSVILSGRSEIFRCPPDLRDHIASVVDKSEDFSVLRDELGMMIGKILGGQESSQKIRTLSKRELEIFHWIGEGMSTKEIAVRAGISPFTVETHRKNIAAKLGMSASSLVREASIQNLAKRISTPVDIS